MLLLSEIYFCVRFYCLYMDSLLHCIIQLYFNIHVFM